jgi:hypothetical protein
MNPIPPLETLILTLRQQEVILDADQANLYAVTTKALNQAVRRNTDRFPPDFVFQLMPREIAALRSQIVTSTWQITLSQYDGAIQREPSR